MRIGGADRFVPGKRGHQHQQGRTRQMKVGQQAVDDAEAEARRDEQRGFGLTAVGRVSRGGSFQRALLCDIRVAAEGTRFRLPELTYGVIPDTGGMGALFETCGAGLVSDLVLTGRVMPADEAFAHGIVSRIVAPDDLDATAREMAEQIAAAPAVTVKMAREVIRHLAQPQIRSSMADEMIYQTFINRSDDMAELRAARAEERPPRFTGS